MWPAVDEKETASYGKTIEKTRLKPVFVNLIAPEDIEANPPVYPRRPEC
jgi:hypothetical protein